MSSYGSMFLTIEANKENIPPGMLMPELGKEPIVLPEEPRRPREEGQSPVPRPSPAMSQMSDVSLLSAHDSPAVNTSADEGDDDSETTSRKEKSLGLLCQRFLIAMNEETRGSSSGEVHLETVAKKMNVEKRRIYDIVNVMEALDAMQKTNKSFYRWQGLDDLPKLMADLQKEAVEEHLPERVLRVEQAMCSFTELSPGNRKPSSREVVGTFVGDAASTSGADSKFDFSSTAVLDSSRKSRVDSRDRQGRNSLAQLCRRFLMVLLSNPKNIRKVSLDVASTVLIKDPETEGFEPPSRSRCRRLYDIANVLVALGLIKKVHYLFGTKKIPLFVYCGPEPDEKGKFDANACVEKLLLSSQQTPLTPQMKATTAQLAQQLTIGKRSRSEAVLNKSANTCKMPRIRSEDMPPPSPCSLMMFAELAAAERMRLDVLAQHFGMSQILPSTSSGGLPRTVPLNPPTDSNMLSKPQPQRFVPTYGQSIISTPQAFQNSNYKPNNNYAPIGRVYDEIPMPKPQVRRPCPLPFATRSPFKQNTTRLPPPSFPSLPSLPSIKYSMSNILATSNKMNIIGFEHEKHSSPFQEVKKGDARPKKVFGEIQNFQ